MKPRRILWAPRNNSYPIWMRAYANAGVFAKALDHSLLLRARGGRMDQHQSKDYPQPSSVLYSRDTKYRV
jgi:hypothetical protein